MKKIGVTGGIGAGKSTVCRVFRALGIPIYEADERAKWLTNHDPILRADLVRLLGPNAYDALGHYNRAFVAAQVFTDPALLHQLNALIHPRVFADTARWVADHATYPYVIKEAALMNAAGPREAGPREAGQGNDLDAVVVVTAPESLRIERVRLRDPHRSVAEIQAIMARQLSEEARLQLADYVLHNDEKKSLIPQLLALDEAFRK
jgi:dephospho-CoA kinase